MKNIHVLPTEKPSRFYTYKGVLNIAADEFVAPTIFKNDLINLNIYITSDEEIKDDWCYDEYNKVVFKNTGAGTLGASKKIILTTDPSLDGVQVIDDEFLEWFVKNPSCESVEVKEKQHFESDKTKRDNPLNGVYYCYKIIIPKEEPKQMNKQTAVEWFNDEIIIHLNFDQRLYLKDILKQAKEMEKEQIKEAYMSALPYGHKYSHYDKFANKYYNEIYKKE
jgi:hypothetical protein